VIERIRRSLNPHPAGQLELNVPRVNGEPQPGMQHKYRETVLFFPSQGQTCHAYCTYCFRWAQFVGMDELKFANNEAESLVRYVREHPEVRDVLITGGDPMIMRTGIIEQYIRPLLEIESLHSIRFGTKALAWWPYRFVSDSDADDLMRLFEDIVESGKHLALMAHYSHPRELSTDISDIAIRRIQGTGATIRSQAPLIRQVNDCPDTWATMWQMQVDRGIIPYYMFVERDTGPRRYFDVPLHRALDIFTRGVRQVSGLGRTVRGPSMSCTPGKVLVDGIAEINGERYFALKFLQGRDANWTNRMFFAHYDEDASWIDDLRPAFADSFFFEERPSEARKWKNFAVYPGAKGTSVEEVTPRLHSN
jgi:KamA family protein